MTTREDPLENGGFYHIFNRSICHQPIFISESNYQRAIETIKYYQHVNPPFKYSRLFALSQEDRERILEKLDQDNQKQVEIISFALMPTHFHFLLKQTNSSGISSFISKFSNSYSKYFNTKYVRYGPIFQGTFKSVLIDSEEMLKHISRYIHLNPVVSNIIDKNKIVTYPYTSLPYYLDPRQKLINSSIVLSGFKSIDDYLTFIYDQVEYGRELEKMKHLALDMNL